MARLPRSTRRKIQLAYARCRNASSVARKFHVDPKTVHHWIAKTNDDDPVSESAGRGRKPALDTAEARTAYKMLKSGKYNGALHVARELHKRSPSTTDKPAAKSTIIKHAKAYATSIGDCLVCDKRKPVQQLPKPHPVSSHQTLQHTLEGCLTKVPVGLLFLVRVGHP